MPTMQVKLTTVAPLQDARNPHLEDSIDPSRQILEEEPRCARSMIKKYLLGNVEEFRRLTELREQGWSNQEGDRYFQKQRHNADNADEKMSQFFYKMMKEISQEMHQSTGALAICKLTPGIPTILDLCMAPGGFLAKALSINLEASALGFSLPISEGGHRVLLPTGSNVKLQFLDITMLAADMGVTDIPPEHPDATKLLPRHFLSGQLFNLVLCDGQVLRTHERAPYREIREARRLTVTQLAIGLEHLEVGGTMIVLLHKVEAPTCVSLLYTFNRFSSIKLFKPTRHHGKRSSFYMIATNVQSRHCEAVKAVETWKKQWKTATFGTDMDYEEELRTTSFNTEEVLEEFGPDLVRLGREIWKTQARSLAKAPFIKK